MDLKEFEIKVLASLDRILDTLEKPNGRVSESSAPEVGSDRECSGNINRSPLEPRTELESSRWGDLEIASDDNQRLDKDLRQKEKDDTRDYARPERSFRKQIERGVGGLREED